MKLLATIQTKGHIFDGTAPAIVNEKLESAMYEAVSFLEEMVKANLPSNIDGRSMGVGVFGDQGGLRSTIAGEVQKGSPIVKGIISHSSVYGDVIEKGRQANKAMPPKGVLVRWMEVKLGMGKELAQKLEFVFRRKIARKGFPGVHMFERAWLDHESRVFEIFDRYGFVISKSL